MRLAYFLGGMVAIDLAGRHFFGVENMGLYFAVGALFSWLPKERGGQ